MAQKTTGSEMALHSDRLGSEEKIQSVLADWGLDKATIRRVLDEHRTRQMNARESAFEKANIALGIRVNRAPVNYSSSPSRR